MRRLLLVVALLVGGSSFAAAQPLAVAQAGPLGLSGTTCVPGASSTATSCLLLNVTGLGTASVSISGTYSGTITFTGSNGGPYVNVGCTSTAAGSAAANTTTGTGTFICPVAGLRILEANITSYSSGTAVAWMLGAPGGGAGGGGGGASGSVTQGTNPWVTTGDGTAGVPSTGVSTVQGTGSGTPLPVSNTDVTAMSTSIGTTTDAKVCGDSNGTVEAKLRCLSYIFNAAFDSGNSRLNTATQNGSTTDADDASVAAGQSSIALTIPLSYRYNGSAWVREQADPCSYLAKTRVVVSISTATTTQLIAASASNYNYICDVDLFVSAADNVALVEDDTAACASPTAGMAGGVTAATGWNWAANQGLAKGNGIGTVFKTAATNRYTCLITSSTAQLSGSLSYVQVP